MAARELGGVFRLPTICTWQGEESAPAICHGRIVPVLVAA